MQEETERAGLLSLERDGSKGADCSLTLLGRDYREGGAIPF